jgi:PAS domain S-box-containing protein
MLREAQRQTKPILESIGDTFVAVDRQWRCTYVNDHALRRTQAARGEPLTREDVLGKVVWDMLPDTVGTEIHARYQEAMREQHATEFEVHVPWRDLWLEVRIYPSAEGLSIYSREITERKHAEEGRQRRARQQAAVVTLGAKALAGTDPRSLMDEAATLVARTLGVEYASIEALQSGAEELLLIAGVGWKQAVVGGTTLPAGSASLAGYALLLGEPVIVGDMAAETRFEVPALFREHGVMSAVTVLIGPRGNPFGTLSALSSERRAFSGDDVNFLQAVANVLATGVERAEADERLEAARETERSRIARDLHDEALSDLTDAVIAAQLAKTQASDAETAGRVGELVPKLVRVGQLLRAAIYDLSLGGAEDEPFPELLKSLVAVHRAMARGYDIELELRGRTVGSLGQSGTQLLRIVGEALTNARRHSGATINKVSVRGSSEKVTIEVSDDGCGFDPEAATCAAAVTGIRGMQERARIAGAELTIDSEPGVGTVVHLEFPLAKPAAGG